MNFFFKIALLSSMTLLVSCAPGIYDTFQGTYNIQNTAETTRNYDEVWADVIDFFANNGIPIATLEKASGLIVSKGVIFRGDKITMESNTTYKPINPDAYIVVPNMNNNIIDAEATMDFNVRVRNDEKRVVITINLLDISASVARDVDRTSFQPAAIHDIPAKSTGVFESQLLDLFR